MPREFSSVNLSIWQDDDWRDLPPAAQHLYLTLWTHPGLSYCGVVDWRPGRLAALSSGWTSEHVRQVADCLEARLFIVTDDETEECLIRSWVRFDGLLKQPRLAVSFANAYSETASRTLRGVIAYEMKKLQEREPGMVGWSKPQVLSVLDATKIDPRSRALPSDPFGDGFASDLGMGLPQTLGNVSGSVSLPPTPAPTPATSHQHQSSETKAPAEFDDWYAVYPRKVGKGAAVRAFAKALKKTDAQTLTDALRRQLPWFESQDKPSGDFRPYPATWLNEERWADDPEVTALKPADGPRDQWARAVVVGGGR